MKKEKDGNIFMKIITLSGLAFAIVFIVIQLVPIGGLGVNFSIPSYIIFAVWIVLGAAFFLWQFLSKKKIEKDVEALNEDNVEKNKEQ